MGRDDRESGGQVVPEQAGAEQALRGGSLGAQPRPLRVRAGHTSEEDSPDMEGQSASGGGAGAAVAANSGDSCNTSGTLMNSDF